MFVQVVIGEKADEARLLRALDEWDEELRPGATGFLGSTAGATDDGGFVLVARFQDAQAADWNSRRPEQGAWWSGVEAAVDGPVEVFDSEDVDLSLGGGSDAAGFVQLLRGRGDRHRAREVLHEAESVLQDERPDILGGLTAWDADGRFVDVAYFTSEDDARSAESGELGAEGQALLERLAAVMPVEQYLDVPRPRLA